MIINLFSTPAEIMIYFLINVIRKCYDRGFTLNYKKTRHLTKSSWIDLYTYIINI